MEFEVIALSRFSGSRLADRDCDFIRGAAGGVRSGPLIGIYSKLLDQLVESTLRCSHAPAFAFPPWEKLDLAGYSKISM